MDEPDPEKWETEIWIVLKGLTMLLKDGRRSSMGRAGRLVAPWPGPLRGKARGVSIAARRVELLEAVAADIRAAGGKVRSCRWMPATRTRSRRIWRRSSARPGR